MKKKELCKQEERLKEDNDTLSKEMLCWQQRALIAEADLKRAEAEKSVDVSTPEDLMNYVRSALRYYRFRGEFRIPQKWVYECERALAVIAYRLNCLDEDVARDVYGLGKNVNDSTVYGVDTGHADV